jgi:hypothetical protein
MAVYFKLCACFRRRRRRRKQLRGYFASPTTLSERI